MNTPGSTHTISVVIPCYDEEEFIERCILSLIHAKQENIHLSVKVCDGFSTDRTREIVNELARTYPEVHLVDNPNKTAPYALNIGIENSLASDVIIILGAHSEVHEDFLVENINVLVQKPEVGCAGGVLENVFLNRPAEIIGKAMSSPFGVGNAHFRTGTKEGYVDTVAFGAYRKAVFEQIGLFDTTLTRNQDDEFNYRLLAKTEFKIYLSNKIRCKYYVRGSYSKLWKQYYQYGYWKVLVNKKHGSITTVRQLFPSALVAMFLFLPFSFLVGKPLVILNVVGVLSYFFLSSLFAIRAGSNKSFISIIKTFLILHFSYGIGYWEGIWDFLLLNKKSAKSQATTSSR